MDCLIQIYGSAFSLYWFLSGRVANLQVEIENCIIQKAGSFLCLGLISTAPETGGRLGLQITRKRRTSSTLFC